MTEKRMKITTNLLDIVQLIDENEVKSTVGEAFASYMLNPSVTWAKFILTDDRKNANGQRVPREEFDNLLRSGIHMPVKMAFSEEELDHPKSKPLGTITHLKIEEGEDGTAKVVALAALWGQERPEDVKLIKKKFNENAPIDISWEILYTDSAFNEAFGSHDLLGTSLRAATIVGNPAYKGRTPILAVASKDSKAEEDESNKLAEDELNELEQLKARVAELEAEKTALASQLQAKAEAEQTKDAEITRLTEEIEPLRQFKAEKDAEAARLEKLASIKQKFAEAGIEKDDEYFAQNEEALMKYDEDQLAFMIQELKAFAQASKETSASSKKTETKIPNVPGEGEEDTSDPKTLGRRLREERSKK